MIVSVFKSVLVCLIKSIDVQNKTGDNWKHAGGKWYNPSALNYC